MMNGLAIELLQTEAYQKRGWTIEINLSTATDTVVQMDPFKDICSTGSSQGKINGWTKD